MKTSPKKNAENHPDENLLSPPPHAGDFISQMNNFREGIRGLSSSIHQVEKTMESITQMMQTLEKLGGLKRLNQFFAGPPPQGQAGERTGGVQPLDQIKRLIAMMERIDFKQVNQILDSPLIQNLLSPSPQKKGGAQD